jgi:hypothetical protein
MMKSRTDRLPDATTLRQKRTFVVASRPVTQGEKTIRHIVILNHPASLRFPFSSDLRPRRRTEASYVVLAIALALVAGLGMLWPLL